MERIFLDEDRNVVRLSQTEFDQAKEVGDLIQYYYAHCDEISAGGFVKDQMTKRASYMIRDRENIKVLAKTIFDRVIDSPKMSNYVASMASNLIENAKISQKLPNPRQIMKDQLLESIRNVERFVKINLNNQKSKIISQVIGIVSLIAHLYNKNFVDGEIIFNWLVNVLVSDENKFVRNTMLAIIREKINAAVVSDKVDSVTLAVDKIIKEANLCGTLEGNEINLEKISGEDNDDNENELMETESMQSIDESDK